MTTRLPSTTVLLLLLVSGKAFTVPYVSKSRVVSSVVRVRSMVEKKSKTASLPSPSTAVLDPPKKKQLGLLTFDLDDTLYPIAPVIEEANVAFVNAMKNFGFEGINASDIDETCKQIRQEADADAVYLTHTQVREKAIRRKMEQIVYERKLKETAYDWGTQVSDLANLVEKNVRKWAHAAVSDSIVSAVLTAWEMERHHAAERNLYPEVVDILKQLKKDHPDVIIGAVTDGKANPMFMMFTLAPYFDFCMSWEDDQGERSQFFQELSSVEGDAQLTWIYKAAYDKYLELASAAKGMSAAKDKTGNAGVEDLVWVHVGDDLFYDVGGSSSCGAKTVLVKLAKKYGQTAGGRFDDLTKELPAWSTSTKKELEKRRVLNEAARDQVDQEIEFLTLLPDAIDKILSQREEEESVEENEKAEEQQDTDSWA